MNKLRKLPLMPRPGIWILFVLVITLSGCDGDPQVLPDSQIRVQPENLEVDIGEVLDEAGNCVFLEDFYQDVPVNISLLNSDGFAIGDAPVSIYLDYSENLFPGFPVMQLYHDSNGNGLVDSRDELVSGSKDDIFRADTESYDGNVMLLVRMNLSCAYRGNLYAFSGPVVGSLSIQTNAQ